MTTKDLLTVGVVLSAKDMYSSIFNKAKTDLRNLNADAAVQARQFEKSLTLGKGLIIGGGTAAVIGAGISRVFEDVVRTAGEQMTNLNDVLIAAGDQSEGFADRTEAALDRVKDRWGFADSELSASVKDIGGRTRDYEGALEAVGVAASLARARKLSLAEATELLSDRVAQQSDEEKKGLSLTERYQGAAAKLAVVQKALGSNSEMLGSFMGRMGAKTTAAGISFDEVGALMMEMGRAGVSARAGMQPFEAMLDAMRNLPGYASFNVVFPKYSKSGSIVDMLDEVKARLDQMPSQTEKLNWLNKTFGAGAEMVLSFTQNLDGIRKSRAELSLAKYSDVVGKGAAQMETWAGTQAQATTAAEQFKEMVGKYSVPVVMSLQRQMISLSRMVDGSPFWAELLGRGMVIGGGMGELAKVLGPVVAAAGMLVSWRTQQGILKAVNGLAGVGTSASGAAAALGPLGLAGAAALAVLALGAFAASQPGYEGKAAEFVPGGQSQWMFGGMTPITPGAGLTPWQQYAQQYGGPGVTLIPARAGLGTARPAREIATTMPESFAVELKLDGDTLARGIARRVARDSLR